MKKLLLSFLLLMLLQGAHGAPQILVLGDSLSAAHGMEQNAGWVNLLQQRLSAAGFPHQVINASISGETTSGALARLSGELKTHRPAIVIIELGGNDGLRGLPLRTIEQNLAAIIEEVQKQDIAALLVGMRLPPNYGRAYTEQFEAIYPALARRFSIPLVPFLLAGLENDKSFFQNDGIHPTATAQKRLLENIWPHLMGLL